MKNKMTAFSLGEVLVTLAVVGVIAALILPTLKHIQPDKQKLMFKKAYNSVERGVTELINDDLLYPEVSGKKGFDYTDEVEFNNTKYSGNKKFCQLFTLKLNNISSTNIECPAGALTNGTPGTPTFTTNDGIEFYIPNSDFTADTEIKIDINGEKAPNCTHSASCTKPDRYSIFVAPDGGISVKGDLEKSFLKSTNITKD